MVTKTYVDQEDETDGQPVPAYIVEDLKDLSENKETPLRRTAEKFQFPLKTDDYKDLAMLGLRFEKMDYAAGLSLPQLGINRRAIMFMVKKPGTEEEGKPETQRRDDDEPIADDVDPMKELDVQALMEKKDPNVIWPKTLWINPTYTIPRDAVLDEDYEICYSLKCEKELVVGPVFRLNRINYRAYDSRGRIYEGQAEGLVARIIQHEIDHLDGKLYIDYVQPDRVMPLPEYVSKTENGLLPPLEKGIVPQFSN